MPIRTAAMQQQLTDLLAGSLADMICPAVPSAVATNQLPPAAISCLRRSRVLNDQYYYIGGRRSASSGTTYVAPDSSVYASKPSGDPYAHW